MSRSEPLWKIIERNMDKTDSEIGEILGVSRRRVIELRKKYGLMKQPNRIRVEIVDRD